MVSFCICFPGGTKVTTKQGLKRLDELLTTEEVLTFSQKRESQKWTEFYTWGHREVDRVAEFLVLKVGDGKELQISSQHLLFIADGHKGRRLAKRAGEVKIGDRLFHFNPDGNSSLEELPVIEITTIESTGVYAPFTRSGDFFANGFLVACYANVYSFSMAHAALAPLRAWYKYGGHGSRSKPGVRSTIPEEGIHEYARKLWKIRNIFTASSAQNTIKN